MLDTLIDEVDVVAETIIFDFGDLTLFTNATEFLASDVKGEVDVVVEAILFEFGDVTLFSIASEFLANDVSFSNVVSLNI